jgi:hypothetical protein
MSHPQDNHFSARYAAPIALALSLSLTAGATLPVFAAPGDTNSTNNGSTISGGTYYNTPGDRTTFVNQGGTGGLFLPSGQTVTGLETVGGIATGNGGTLHFYAPGAMVRLDGNVNVSAILSGNSYMGNGGRVFVDAGMLYQNGTIFANGINGGAIQFNVGSAMFGPTSRVEAQGFGGLAGTIGVNASGTVDIAQGAIIDASGHSINSNVYSDNVNVNIVGSLVNNAGIIRANAVNIEDGNVTLLPEETTTMRISEAPTPVPSTGDNNGGVIRIVATGQTRSDCVDCIADKAVTEGILTTEEADTLKTRQAELIAAHEGDVVNTGTIQANGGNGAQPEIIWAAKTSLTKGDWSDHTPKANPLDGGNGGTIIASAASDIINDGLIQANGGNGGDASYFGDYVLNKSKDYTPTSPAGKGGNGGTISLSAVHDVVNGTTAGSCKGVSPATIEANGGNGGSIAGTYESTTVISASNPVSPPPSGSGKSSRYTPTPPPPSPLSADITADKSDAKGADGGNGGIVAISYGDSATNNGSIAATGGTGGTGQAVDLHVDATTTKTNQKAITEATAIGGDGGNGGKGGLVVFSGDHNPTGSGLVTVKGGNGGKGGDAFASTLASSSTSYAEATAYAIGGDGGKGGKAGYVITPKPSTATFAYNAKDGRSGDDGQAVAYAEAKGIGIYDKAKAVAIGNDTSSATAIAFFDSDSTFKTYPTIDIHNNALLTTQNNELLFNGNTVILMTRNGSIADLTGRINNAYSTGSVRSVDKPFGIATAPQMIRHFVVASTTPQSSQLILDKTFKSLNNLTSLTVTTDSGLLIPTFTGWNTGITNFDFSNTSSGGGHISIVAPNGTLINGGALTTFGRHTGGSIALAAKEIKNGLDNCDCNSSAGTILTNGQFHGGSIILKGEDAVENLAVTGREGWAPSIISTSGVDGAPTLGGVIRLQSFGRLFNEGHILANATHQGGAIIAKAGTFALNNGLVQANALHYDYSEDETPIYTARVSDNWEWDNEEEYPPTAQGTGGFIRWHGNGFGLNNFGASLEATGGEVGGVIQLTAGGPTDFAPADLPFALTGLGITQGTLAPTSNGSLITSTAFVPLGTAANAGIMDVRGAETIGKIDIAGDGFAGLTADAIVNGVEVGTNAVTFFSNPAIAGHLTLTAGEGAVKSVACGGPTPENPVIPNTPVLTFAPEIKGFNFDILGLPFQYQRPNLTNIPTSNKLILRLGQPKLFLAKSYAPVTQEILKLALKEHNRELALGHTVSEALASTIHYLKDAGVDSDIAQQLIEGIKDGDYTAETPVTEALKAIANVPTTDKLTLKN